MAPTTERRHHLPHDVGGGDPRGLAGALERTTDLGVVAHPDDLELLALPGIAACRDDPHRSFTGVVCTDGGGSVQVPSAPAGPTGSSAGSASAGSASAGSASAGSGPASAQLGSAGAGSAGAGSGPASAPLDRAALVDARWAEQCAAADLGGYGAVIGLGHTSEAVRSDAGHERLVEELFDLVDASRPANVYTHNPVDKHPTHVAVVAALVKAVRRMPWGSKPHRLVGVEAWRDLDWLPDAEKVRLDVSAHASLAGQLVEVFATQVGPKRYDLAAAGRRRANATLADPHRADSASEVIVAMDLSPLIHNDDLDPVRFVLAAVDRFRAEVATSWGRWF